MHPQIRSKPADVTQDGFGLLGYRVHGQQGSPESHTHKCVSARTLVRTYVRFDGSGPSSELQQPRDESKEVRRAERRRGRESGFKQ